jgi:hypothetical protein
MTQAILQVAWLVESLRHQRFYLFLRSRPDYRSHTRLPSGVDFDVRRQTSRVDEALGIADCHFVERGDPRRERIDKLVKLSIR